MTTVGNVIDRLYREFLTPAAESPAYAELNEDITDSQATFALDLSMLAADEEGVASPGVVLEIAREQMLVTSYSASSSTITVRRGHNGTTAAAHDDGDPVTFAPQFARQVAFDAVADEILSLHPTLWGKDTVTTTSADEYVEVPSSVVGVAAVVWEDTGSNWQAGRASLLRDFPPSATNKAVQFVGIPTGKTTYITTKNEFSRTTSEADSLADLMVEEQWVTILLYGAASRLSAYVDPTKLNVNMMVDRSQSETVPVGSGTVLERRLRSIRNDKLQEANKRQDMEYPPVTTYTSPFRPASSV